MENDEKIKEIEIITYTDLRMLLCQTFDKLPFESINKYDISPATFERIAKVYNLVFCYKDFNELLRESIDIAFLRDLWN